ncbi:MAG TPA: TonB-dependent receptor [Polyangiaceae bacterium]|nr:TonB-dependent receptor [Polyangiaceae bacterium]
MAHSTLLSRLARLAQASILTGALALALDARADDGDAELDSIDLLELLNVEVSTASKTAESMADAPAIMTVISAEEIARWGYQSVGEALQHVVGFYLIDDHVLPNAGVRGVAGGLGAESGSVKVMIDGASVAFRSTSGNWLGVELIPLGSIAQIEIIRGPASALYGADAFLGVVNIITLPPDEIPLVRAAVRAGNVGSHFGGQFDVVGGKRFGAFDLLLGAAGEAQDRSGLRLPSESPAATVPSYADVNEPTRNLKRKSLVLEARAGYRRDELLLGLHAFASGIERGGDLASWAQLTNGVDAQGRPVGTVINLGQARITANADWALTPELKLSAQSTYFQGGLLPNDRIEVASDLFWVKRRLGYRGLEATAEGYWAPRSDFNVIFGGEVVVDRETLPTPERISKETGEVLGTAPPDGSATLSNIGIFLSSNWKLWEPLLKLTNGVRLDQHSTYGSQLTGRIGATSEWTPWLVTKVLYGSAFKAPSPYLLYAQPLRAGDLIGVRDLAPQHVDTAELQALVSLGSSFSASSGISYNLIREKAEFVPQGLNQIAQNIAKQRTYNWETRVDANYHQRLAGYASFEWIHSHRELGQEGYATQVLGTENVAYPNWIARAGVTLSALPDPAVPVELSTQAIVVGPTPAADASIVERGERFELPGYLWLNASLAARNLFMIAGHETTIALRAKNLLGEKGPVPGFSGFEYPLAPREVFIELQHSY